MDWEEKRKYSSQASHHTVLEVEEEL